MINSSLTRHMKLVPLPQENKASFSSLWIKYHLSTRTLAHMAKVSEWTVLAMYYNVPVHRIDAQKVLASLSRVVRKAHTLRTVYVRLIEEVAMSEQEEEAKEQIKKMNDLWKAYCANGLKSDRNAFVQCQQWLSNRGFRYYQEEHTGQWMLI